MTHPSFWTHGTIRALEHDSIRRFVESCGPLFDGARVLDYGCGKQPYKSIVEAAGGTYEPYDRKTLPANVSDADVGEDPRLGDWRDVILCNQIIQYVPDPVYLLRIQFKNLLRPGGALVMTYPTCWDEVEPADLHRFTRWGMERLLKDSEFTIERHQRRAEIDLGGFKFPLGYGVVARA